jgi:hypothetical protein
MIIYIWLSFRQNRYELNKAQSYLFNIAKLIKGVFGWREDRLGKKLKAGKQRDGMT